MRELTRREAIEVIKTEKECVKRNVAREHDVKDCGCDRDCLHCDLLMTEEDIQTAYDMAIDALKPKSFWNSPVRTKDLIAFMIGLLLCDIFLKPLIELLL